MKKIILALGLILASVAAFADSTTTRTGITKPTIGSAGWGTKLNSDFDLIDSTFGALGQANTWTATNTFVGPTIFSTQTLGQLPYIGTSGLLSFLSTGTVGYVLQSNGAGAPTWTAISSDGGGVLSATQTWTGGNTWNSSSTWNNYAIFNSTAATATLTFSQVPAGSSYPMLVGNGYFKFGTDSMGGNATEYYLGRGTGVLSLNAPTSQRVDILNNNSSVVSVGGGGVGIKNTNPQSLIDATGTGASYVLRVATTSAVNNLRVTNAGNTVIGDIQLAPGSTTAGPGGNAFNGGILTQSVYDGGNYQVSSYQLSPTTGTLPAWGPISENVWQGTVDQSTNLSRISLTAMAAFADPNLGDAANDFRLQEEAGGTVPIKPMKFTSSFAVAGSSTAVEEYMTFNTTFTVLATTNSIGDVLFFRRLDPPMPTGNNTRIAIGQMRSSTNAVLTGAGTQDSPKLEIFGNGYDTSLHSSRWQHYVGVTSNAGASTYHLQNRIDSGSFSDKLVLTDAGYLGLGTGAPTDELSVWGRGAAYIASFSTSSTGSPLVFGIGGSNAGSSYNVDILSGHISFQTASMGGNASEFYIARGGGTTMGMNVPTGGTFNLLVNNSQTVNVNASGLSFGNTATQGVVGTTTNDSAAAGDYGEFVSSATQNVSAAGTTTFGNIASTTTTSGGDFKVVGTCELINNSATETANPQMAISAFSGNTTTDHVAGDTQISTSVPIVTGNTSGTVEHRFSVTSSTTFYVKTKFTFSAGTPQASCSIKVWRTR